MHIARLALLTGLLVLGLSSSASARTLNDPCEQFGSAGGVVAHAGGSMVCGPKLTIDGTQRMLLPLAPLDNRVVATAQCPPGQRLDRPLMADGVYDYHDLIALARAKTQVHWDYWSAWVGWIYWDVTNDNDTSFRLGAGGPDEARIPILNAWTQTGAHVARLILHCSGASSTAQSFDVAADTSPGRDDVIRGGAGDDKLRGGPGRDVLHPGPGNDRVDAGIGRDMVVDTGGRDIIRLGPGHDTANLRDGARDRISCGAGEDAVVVDPVDRVDDDCEHPYPGATPAVPPVLGD